VPKSPSKPQTSGPKPPRTGRTAATKPRSSKQPDSYAAIANQYARDVVAGRILACKWVRLACQRHLDDLARERDAKFPYRFDRKKAVAACRHISLLPHTKGQWARPVPGHVNRIRLEPWQVFKTACIFGWVEKATDLRRFRKAYICIPRKNAKSTWAAGVGHYMFEADGEYGAEVYSGATTEKQAWEVFRVAWLMAKKTPELQHYFGVQVNAKSLVIEEDYSRFEPVVGNPGDGASPSCAIVDEYHEHATSDLYDTMLSGMGAREQPLILVITTAGSSIEGPCYTMQQEAQKVLEGLMEDDELFALIYTIDEGDDWKCEEAIRKANPNFDVSVKASYLRSQIRNAVNSAHKQALIKTKHLNIWVNSRTGWMNMDAWRRCEDRTLNIADFSREPCWEGVDLAAVVDLASRCKVFARQTDGLTHYYAFSQHYAPQDRIQDGEHQHYLRWAEQERLTGHPGPEIQLSRIQRDIEEDIQRFRYRCIAFDPWSALQMQQDLAAHLPKDTVITIPQTTQFLSPAMKEVEAAVLSGRFHHDGDPVLAWAVSNIVVKPDANDNIFPRKEQHGCNKIDPASALFNAVSPALRAIGSKRSVYETRGLVQL
jgi:phage terminase large subunit-like protein